MKNRREEPDTSQNAYRSDSHPASQEGHERLHKERVGVIQTAIANARADHQATGQRFDPKIWVGERLMRTISHGQEHDYRLGLSLAWDAISHPYIENKEYQAAQKATLVSGTALRRSNLVILDQNGTDLLHAMADAVGIPFDPAQKTIDLLPTDAQKQFFRQVHTKIARETGI